MTNAAPTTPTKTILMATVDTLPRTYEVLTMLTALANANFRMKLRNVNEIAADDALKALNEQAIAIGADAVIGIRFDFPYPGQIHVSGTAVRYLDK